MLIIAARSHLQTTRLHDVVWYKVSIHIVACMCVLTHWGRVTHICVSKLTIIGSDNGLSPGRRQAIIWTNAGILLIRILRTNFSDILSKIHSFSFKKMHLKMSSAKWRLFCLGLNELNNAMPLPLGPSLGPIFSITSVVARMYQWHLLDIYSIRSLCRYERLLEIWIWYYSMPVAILPMPC